MSFGRSRQSCFGNKHSNFDNRSWNNSEISVIRGLSATKKHCCVVKKKLNFSEQLRTLLYFTCLRLHREVARNCRFVIVQLSGMLYTWFQLSQINVSQPLRCSTLNPNTHCTLLRILKIVRTQDQDFHTKSVGIYMLYPYTNIHALSSNHI